MSNSIGLVHSSDLHIGRDPANDQFTNVPLKRYGNAHAFMLGRGLREALDDVAVQCQVATDRELFHVMSGDLSATGHAKEFLVAHTFLRSLWRELREPESSVSGVNLNDSISHPAPRLATVPGNHDQWHGQSYLKNVGYNPTLRGRHFRSTFWRRSWQSGQFEFELYGLDSNAGLPQGHGSWRQRGELDLTANGEVDEMEKHLLNNPSDALPSRIGHRVRALVLHHSLASGGGLKTGSRTKLLELAESHGFAAILTGHTHDFLQDRLTTLSGRLTQVYELRSASAMQGPETRLNPSPGFLAHRIFVDRTQKRWQSWRYVWDSTLQGFAILRDDAKAPFADFVCP